MTLKQGDIIQEARQEFEVIMSYVRGEATQQARADAIELGLLRRYWNWARSCCCYCAVS